MYRVVVETSGLEVVSRGQRCNVSQLENDWQMSGFMEARDSGMFPSWEMIFRLAAE